MTYEQRSGRGAIRQTTLDTTEAKALAFDLAEEATGRMGPTEDTDGVVRAPWVQRDGERLQVKYDDGWIDISGESPRPDHSDGPGHSDAGVTHPESPVRTLKGWHDTGDGLVLVSTEGAGWRAEVYIPNDAGVNR